MSAQNTGSVIGPSERAKTRQSGGARMSDISIISNGDVTDAVSSALRRAFAGTGNAVKLIAMRTRRNTEATRNWVEGRNAPRAAELIELCKEFDEVWEEVCRLAGRIPPENKMARDAQLLEEFARRLQDHRRGIADEGLLPPL